MSPSPSLASVSRNSIFEESVNSDPTHIRTIVRVLFLEYVNNVKTLSRADAVWCGKCDSLLDGVAWIRALSERLINGTV
jgi:hypothetical protein